MSSNLKVNTILPSAGTAIGIGTDGGTISLTGSINIGTGSSIFTPASNTLTFGTNSNERLRIASNGRVGINESTPLGKLHVKSSESGGTVGASADELVLESSANTGITILSGTANEGAINFGDSGDNNIGKIVYMHDGDYMYFKTNDTEKLRITSSGNLNVLAGQVTVATPEFLRVAHTVNTQNQSLTDNATHWVQFGSAYDDTKSGWTSGANNYYTIQTAGYFLVTAQAVFHSNTASTLRDWALGVEQSQDNGSSYSLIQNAGGRGGGNQYTDTDAIATCVTFILYFNAGTRIRVRAYANVNGGNWQIDEDLGDVSGGTDYGGNNFDNQRGTRLHIIRLF